MNDDALMERVRQGDEDAFTAIVERYKNPLVNYLTHLMRSRDRAEEIAQDAFVRLYDKAANYRDHDRLGPYLFRIATNLLVSAIRREKRWGLLVPRLKASSTATVASPETDLFGSEIQRQVSGAIARLPIRYRAPLLLFEIEEWSYDEIAEALELRLGTVKSRISRAREMLRKQLAPWWIGGNDERSRIERGDPRAAARDGVAGVRP